MNFRILGVWLALCAIWSSTWVVIKLGLDDLPPFFFAGARFVVASAVLAIVVFARRIPLPRRGREWLFIAATGWLTFTINYGLLFWGERRVDSGLAAVLQAAIPAWGMVFAHFYVPQERLTPAKVGGVSLGLVGLSIIFSNEMHLAGTVALQGSAAIVIGGISTAYASVLVKAYARHLDPAVLAGGQMFFGWIPLVVIGCLLEGDPRHYHWTWPAVVDLLYLALVGSAAAFCMLYWLVRRVAVTKIMLISLVTPVAAVLVGAATLGERLSARSLGGAACVLLGLGLVIYKRAPVPIAAAHETDPLENMEG